MLGGNEVIIVLIVVLLLFGSSQVPKLARNLGKAQKEFKDSLDESKSDPTPGSTQVVANDEKTIADS